MINQLGKYEIRRELARGAMGIVYEGYDPLIKRRVALKTIRPDQLEGGRGADMLARFRREAQAAGRLSHPNIVAIYDFDEDAGTAFIAMEFVDGRELKECFDANERFRMADVVRIMTAILDALDYSHRLGVVHRDVKPANIFLLDDGGVKVADFGIAHIESSNLTQVGTVVGTPNYMSPEQIMGLPVDGRTDLFAAGVILYQFLTGERPFAGSTTTTMQKVLKEEPLPPSTLNVQLPSAFDAIVRKALAKRPDDRYATAREFAQALEAAARVSAPVRHDPDATVPNLAGIIASVSTPADVAATTTATASSSSTRAPESIALPGRLPHVGSPPPLQHTGQRSAIAIVAVIAVIGIGALGATWALFPRENASSRVHAAKPKAPAVVQAPATATRRPEDVTASSPPDPTARAANASAERTGDLPSPSASGVAVAENTRTTGARSSTTAAAPRADAPPGKLLVTAVGFADPSNARYASDPARLQADVRADSRSQLVAKTLRLMLERDSFATNYELLQSRMLAESGSFVSDVVRESAPSVGKDGLMSMTTQALVDVEAVRRALERMSREERVGLIRASGDPRIAVAITVRDEDNAAATASRSPVAENVVKERIQSFGFRTWSEAAPAAGARDADFVVRGDVSLRKLSTRLAASGLVITKYALASWTVKCTDRASGEEIYFSTALPKASGSFASEDAALRAIGTSVAEQFSRDFFVTHVPIRGRRIGLVVAGLPDETTQTLFARELMALPGVIAARPAATDGGAYDIEIGPGAASDAIARDVVKPLNAKLGDACVSVGVSESDRVNLVVDARCSEGLRARLETNPPAALYDAPPARRKAIISNPDTLRKLAV